MSFYRLTVLMLLLLSACAKNVTSLKTDQDKILDNDFGYLLIGIETNRNLKEIQISGPQDISFSALDLKQGSNFILVDLNAGTYVIEKVLLDNYWRIEMSDEEYWDVKIAPGKINYVGHIDIVTNYGWQVRSKVELINKSSYAMEFMEKRFPNILINRDMHYGGPGEDSFFSSLNYKKLSKDD